MSEKSVRVVPIRRKLIFTNLAILFVAIGVFGVVISRGVRDLSTGFSKISADRSQAVKSSYQTISDENIQKIKTIFREELEKKGRRLLTKDSSSLAPMIADNAFLSVQQFLQKTFEDDSSLEMATYYFSDKGKIQAFHYVSRDYPGGLESPVTYNKKKKGWEGVTKEGKKKVFISDPEVLNGLKLTNYEVKLKDYTMGDVKKSGYDCIIPFVEGKTGDRVKEAMKKKEPIGYMRYLISTDLMRIAIEAEKKSFEKRLQDLEKENTASLIKSQAVSNAASERLMMVLAISAAIVAFGGLLASSFSANRMANPIKLLTGIAKSMAQGNYAQTISLKSNDEIGILANAFQAMSNAILKRDQDLAEINKNLEKIVEERTAQIRTILNNVQCGFVLIGKDLLIQEGYTKYCDTLFDKRIKAGMTLPEVVQLNERDGSHFSVVTEQVFEDILDEALNLDQIPKKYKMGNKVILLAGSVVRDEKGNVKSILFTIIDGTEIERVERENRTNKALLKLLMQRDAFQNLIKDVKKMIATAREAVPQGDKETIRIVLHTLKGNLSAFGLLEVGALIHHIEDAPVVNNGHLDEIENAVKEFLNTYYNILTVKYDGDPEPIFQISKGALDKFSAVTAQAKNEKALKETVQQWIAQIQMKKADELIGPIGDYMTKLAERLEKSIQFEVVNGDTLLDPEILKPVFSVLPHLLRNSLDHGIESPSQRGDKPKQGKIQVEFQDSPSEWKILVRDDGRGINLPRVCQKVVEMKIKSEAEVKKMSDDEKCMLIFLDQVSSAETTTDISGRGVGMGAVMSTVKAAHGDIKVSTKAGKGTLMEIVVPKEAPASNVRQLHKAA